MRILIALALIASAIGAFEAHKRIVTYAYHQGFESGVSNEQGLVEYCQNHNNNGEKDENFCVEGLYGTEKEFEITGMMGDGTYSEVLSVLIPRYRNGI